MAAACLLCSGTAITFANIAGPIGGGQPILGAPDLVPSVTDSDYLRFHGRGDVFRTAVPFNACAAFPSGATADPGSALHARLRVRLAPESEYEILDKTNNGAHAPGRVLWTQSLVDQSDYAGFTIAYRHDTDELYFVVGDGGAATKRTRVWRISFDLDDGLFRTIDWSYDEVSGDADCWIDGTYYAPVAVAKGGGAIDPPPELIGAWAAGGSIMGNARADAMYTLAGRGWGNDIGNRDVVWPSPNGTDSTDITILDENTSILGDLSYAAFRWAKGTDQVVGASSWDVELQFDGNTPPVDLANGLDSQSLISAEHDSITPVWLDTTAGQSITSWVIDDLPDPEDTQTRQIMFYHHGLGNQKITVSEDNASGGALGRSLVCVLGPEGDILYWAIKTKKGQDPSVQYALIGQAPTANGQHTIELPAGKAGLYRILVRSTKNEGYTFATDQEALYWGAYAPFSLLTKVDALSQGDVFAYIPQDSSVYDLYLDGVINASQVDLETGFLSPLSANGSAENGRIQYPTDNPDSFLATTDIIRMQLGSDWRIGARRFPLVLSKSQFAAQHYVRAGVIETPTFTLWSPDDKVLRDRIVDIASTGLGNASTISKNFGPQETHIFGNQRKYYSMVAYPNTLKIIHTALEYQVTSTSSAMVGSIDHLPGEASGFLRYGDKTNSEYNFDGFGPAMLFWAGWDDTDANPYYGDVNFAKRARVAALAFARHVQGTRLRRSDADVGLHPGLAGLAGADTFGMALHWGRVYGLFDDDDRAALLPAAVIQLCHILNVNPTTTRNQDAHFLPFLYEVGLLWEQQNPGLAFPEMLSEITHEYAQFIVDRFSPWNDGADVALQEAGGFDGSYSGMQNYAIAMGWIVSGPVFEPEDYLQGGYQALNREWDFLRVTLDRQYGFWTRYMAPPIDLGATQVTFAHDSDSRTNFGAISEQFSGAKRTGSMASPMAARLMLEDGSPTADDLVAGNNVIPADYFPLSLGPAGTAWTNIANGRGGWKFNLLPLYTGGVEHLFDEYGDPKPTGAIMPSEVPVAAGTLTLEQIDNGFISINTPNYYAILSTRTPGGYYYKGAIGKYQEARDIEKTDNGNGGGNIANIAYPNGDDAQTGEEIGGVGLSLFYDKTDGGTVINGRNWTPMTTHQTIGYTTGSGHRRWAEQNSKTYKVTKTYNGQTLVEVELVIEYDLNRSDSESASYHIQRVLTFYPESIDVDVTVSYPETGTPESLSGLYENLPFEIGEEIIGSQERVQRLHGLKNLTMPWVGGSNWDSWIGNYWATNEGLHYRRWADDPFRHEIGWLQESIPLPSPSSPSTLSYTIGVSNPPSSIAHPGTDDGKLDVTYQDAIWFLRAFERGDPEADINGDGEVNAEDFHAILNR